MFHETHPWSLLYAHGQKTCFLIFFNLCYTNALSIFLKSIWKFKFIMIVVKSICSNKSKSTVNCVQLFFKSSVWKKKSNGFTLFVFVIRLRRKHWICPFFYFFFHLFIHLGEASCFSEQNLGDQNSQRTVKTFLSADKY